MSELQAKKRTLSSEGDADAHAVDEVDPATAGENGADAGGEEDAVPAAKKTKIAADADADEPASAPATETPAEPAAPAAYHEQPPPATSGLAPEIQAKLDEMLQSGVFDYTDVDPAVLGDLSGFDIPTAIEILDKYGETDKERIRNKSGFLAGIITRYNQMRQSGVADNQPIVLSPRVQEYFDKLTADGRLTEPIESSVLHELSLMPDAQAVQVMDKFMEVDLYNIKNKSGFLRGIVRRLKDQSSVVDPSVGQAMISSLPYSIQGKFQHMFMTGRLRPDELDPKCYQQIGAFPEDMQINIVDRFDQADLNTVRNKTGFFLGILKRFRQDNPGAGRSGGYQAYGAPAAHPSMYAGYGGMPAYGGYGAEAQYPPQYMAAPAYGYAYGGHMGGGGGGGGLYPSVQMKLDALYTTGRLTEALDPIVVDELRGVPENLANEVMDKFGEVDLHSITSKSGFLKGIIRRVREQHTKSDPAAVMSAIGQLPYSVQGKLQGLFATGMIGQADIEARCYGVLASLPEHAQCDVVDRFTQANLYSVRNKSGFFIGVIKRYREEHGM